jgi:hypothetical protein
MSIEQVNVVDMVAYSDQSPNVKLIISDHLEWRGDTDNHLLLLQEKINTYLRFIEGGELVEKFPNVKGLPVVVQVVGKHALSSEAQAFLSRAAQVLEAAGYRLEFELQSAQEGKPNPKIPERW